MTDWAWDDGGEFIRVGRAEAMTRIEMNRPDALNSWTPDLARELLAAIRAASADTSVRAVLITGAGRSFCAGADVKIPRELRPDGTIDLTVRLRTIYNPIVLEMRHAQKPFVAAIQGTAAGLGVSYALACDLILAGESANLMLAFVKIALLPDAGVLRFLAERVGLARAAELAMLGDKLPAAKALDWGLVNAVHPDDELLPAAEALCARLASMPTVAIANIKRTLTETVQADLAAQMDIEAQRQQDHATTYDYAEGRAAFVEKRAPVFLGR
jgi:2-(1,2-epoxy-1,2-dihydrophenyl)acetyl-CoA isomerase